MSHKIRKLMQILTFPFILLYGIGFIFFIGLGWLGIGTPMEAHTVTLTYYIFTFLIPSIFGIVGVRQTIRKYHPRLDQNLTEFTTFLFELIEHFYDEFRRWWNE